MAVELPHLDLGAQRGIGDVHAAKGNVLLQDRGAGGAGDRADLGAADMDAIALPRRLIAVELEADELIAGMLLAAEHRLAADELLITLESDGEADARLEGIDLVGELIAGEDEPRLDPQHIQGLEAQRHDALGLARLEDRIPDGGRVLGMAEDLVAQLAGIAGARDHDGDPVVIADPPDGEMEPLDLGQARPGRRRPDDALQHLAALGPLHRDIAELVRRGFDPGLETAGRRLVAQPFAGVFVAGDEAIAVGAHAEGHRIVDHPAALVAERRIGRLPFRQPAHVAGAGQLHQRLGIGPQHLELAQGREVGRNHPFAAGVILVHGAVVVELGWQPVAAIFREIARQRGGPDMEGSLAGQLGF